MNLTPNPTKSHYSTKKRLRGLQEKESGNETIPDTPKPKEFISRNMVRQVDPKIEMLDRKGSGQQWDLHMFCWMTGSTTMEASLDLSVWDSSFRSKSHTLTPEPLNLTLFSVKSHTSHTFAILTSLRLNLCINQLFSI